MSSSIITLMLLLCLSLWLCQYYFHLCTTRECH